MDKKISVYDINFNIKGKRCYFVSKEKLGEIPYFANFEEVKDYIIYEDDAFDLYDKLELDKTYFLVVEEPWKIYGIICLHKGFTFVDCAEHDMRVIIKGAFPDKYCGTIGE